MQGMQRLWHHAHWMLVGRVNGVLEVLQVREDRPWTVIDESRSSTRHSICTSCGVPVSPTPSVFFFQLHPSDLTVSRCVDTSMAY